MRAVMRTLWQRYALAIPLAAVVTFAVFFLMQTLIASGRSAMTDPADGRVVDFVRAQEEERIQKKDRKPERPPEPEKPPPTPDMPNPDISPASQAGFDIGGVSVDAGIDISAGIDDGSGDGEYLPIVKVTPVYPYRAMSRGLEGWVLLEFTVTTTGAVTDVHVVEAEPANIFDQAAIEAAKKFKYRPRVIDGKPVEVSGVQNLIRFELEK